MTAGQIRTRGHGHGQLTTGPRRIAQRIGGQVTLRHLLDREIAGADAMAGRQVRASDDDRHDRRQAVTQRRLAASDV